VLGAVALIAAGDALGQQVAPQPMQERAQPCAGAKVGSLGLTGWDCRGDCTLALDERHQEKAWSFSVEPRIDGIVAGGPADGILQAGDILVAIDEFLITTKDAGEYIVNLPPDADVKVRFRRGGRIAEATIHTLAACRTSWQGPVPPPPPGPPPAPAVAVPKVRVMAPRVRAVPPSRPDSAPAAAAAPRPRPPRRPGQAPGRARLGIGFQCTNCGTRTDSVARGDVWFFSEPPEVTAVDAAGAADRAGIQIGDRIVAVNGAAITTEAGGRAFTAISTGVEARVTVAKRNGREETVTLTAAIPAPPQPPPVAIRAPESLPLRFSGEMAGVEVEVRGHPVMVSELRGERTIIINADGLWIRIRVPSEGGR
jgi:membrane-associated protease RseP (regulator of RpoE activity)